MLVWILALDNSRYILLKRNYKLSVVDIILCRSVDELSKSCSESLSTLGQQFSGFEPLRFGAAAQRNIIFLPSLRKNLPLCDRYLQK